MLIICFLIAAAVPYLLCGINTAIIVTKIKTGEDIRTMGSGNAGLTNTLRTQGKLAALFVLLGDVAKGVLSVILVGLAFKYIGGVDPRAEGSAYEWVLYAAGTSAILGHVFPVYYGGYGNHRAHKQYRADIQGDLVVHRNRVGRVNAHTDERCNKRRTRNRACNNINKLIAF